MKVDIKKNSVRSLEDFEELAAFANNYEPKLQI
jgi:hypothetical protein